MGDLVWHVPYIRAIAAQSLGGQVAVISAPSTFARELLSGEDCVSEVIDFDRRPRQAERRRGRHGGVLGIFRMGRELRPYHFDRIVIFSDHANRALMALVAGIPERIGYGFSALERALLSHGPYIRNYRGPAVAVYKNASALAVAHGFCVEPVVPKITLRPEVTRDQAPRLAHLPHPLYTFAIGSSEPYKQWGARNFAALATALLTRGCGVVLLGGPGEAPLAQEIVQRVAEPLRQHLLVATSNTMLQSAATLALADANIGNDTGISNLAAALGRPSFVLLGNRPLLSHDPLMRMLLAPSLRIPPNARVAQPPVELDQVTVADVLARLESQRAPGFGPESGRPTGVPCYLDLRGMPLDERLACAWWAQQRHRRTGERFGLLQDEHPEIDLAVCFEETFERLTASDLPDTAWDRWHPGPVWLTVANAFAAEPQAGCFEAIPPSIQTEAEALRAAKGTRRRVLVNLEEPSLRLALQAHLKAADAEIVDISDQPVAAETMSRLMAEMLAADAWVGSVNGLAHLWALLRPEAPQLVLLPELQPAQRQWQTVQQGLGLPHPWSPRPLNPRLREMVSPEPAPLCTAVELMLSTLGVQA